jgi:hypothetical protein
MVTVASAGKDLYSGQRPPSCPRVASDGTYARAMRSEEAMTEFSDYQIELAERYADMDF